VHRESASGQQNHLVCLVELPAFVSDSPVFP